MNPSRSCCCVASSCGSSWGDIRPYSQTSGFTYQINDFEQPYGPDSLLSTYRITRLELVEAPSAVQTRCEYLDLQCCGLAYQYELPDSTFTTCYQEDPVQRNDLGDNLPALSFEFSVQRLQCPRPVEEIESTVMIKWACKKCVDFDYYCSGLRCSMSEFCFDFNQSGPDGLGPQRWTVTNSGVTSSARYVQSVVENPITYDPIVIGQGIITATRSNTVGRFSTSITNNNGNMVSAVYVDRVDFSGSGSACEGGPATPIETLCDFVCDCQSVVTIRTRLTQTIYKTNAVCVNGSVQLQQQALTSNPQDVILTYTGPLDGRLYDSTTQGSIIRTFKLVEAKILDRLTAQTAPLYESYYECDLKSPSGNYDIQECSAVVPITVTVTEVAANECANHCGYQSIPNPVTGVGQQFVVVNGEGAVALGFPESITVTRIAQ